MKAPGQMQWSDCIALSKNPEQLTEYLRARLVMLTTETSTTAIRAIEALAVMDIVPQDDMFSGVTNEELYAIKQRAYAIIKEGSSVGSVETDENSAGAAGIS